MRVVDVHSHVIPPMLVKLMRSGEMPDGIRLEDGEGENPLVVHRQGYRYPLLREFYDVPLRIEQMDAAGIDHALISIAPPLFLYWVDPQTGIEAARLANDAILAMAAEAPDRLTAVATLPMQDPAAAVAELRRCARLPFAAAQIGPHCEGVPLDDPSMREVLATAAEIGLPLILHPYYVGSGGGELDDYYLTNLQGNPWQTAVAASRLIFSGVLDELPNLECVLVHGGGHLPYQVGRLDHGYSVRPETKQAQRAPSEYLRRFHYDALTHSHAAASFLIDLVGSDRVMYGTDTPFDMGCGPLAEQVGESVVGPDREAVAHVNADRLFKLKADQ